MNAEIAVGRLEHALQVVEAQRVVRGERADDAQPNALMNQAIEFRKFRSPRRRLLTSMPASFPKLRLGLGRLARAMRLL